MKNSHLIIFAKVPELGTAKTRLAKGTSDAFALEVYLDLLGITIKEAVASGIPFTVFWNKKAESSFQHSALPSDVQRGQDLGDKMENAFRQKLNEGIEKVLLIGSDCPLLTSHILQNALLSLNDHETVFGPAQDGGYYLIGNKNSLPPIFSDRKWSHAHVLNEATETLKKIGRSYGLLPPLADIDTLADYQRWKEMK